MALTPVFLQTGRFSMEDHQLLGPMRRPAGGNRSEKVRTGTGPA